MRSSRSDSAASPTARPDLYAMLCLTTRWGNTTNHPRTAQKNQPSGGT